MNLKVLIKNKKNKHHLQYSFGVTRIKKKPSCAEKYLFNLHFAIYLKEQDTICLKTNMKEMKCKIRKCFLFYSEINHYS